MTRTEELFDKFEAGCRWICTWGGWLLLISFGPLTFFLGIAWVVENIGRVL